MIHLLNNRPTEETFRVRPCDLRKHRKSHSMLGPCCLCPLMDEHKPDFVEAAIFVATEGPLIGEYIAACAKGSCSYIGEFKFVEHSND